MMLCIADDERVCSCFAALALFTGPSSPSLESIIMARSASIVS